METCILRKNSLYLLEKIGASQVDLIATIFYD